ncbi:hypothetical protein ABZ912_25730 [Nonomuraea angiospora]
MSDRWRRWSGSPGDIGKLPTTVRLDRRVMLCVLMAVLAVAGVPAA